MIAIIGRPNVVVRVYAQTMRVCKQSFSKTLNEIAVLVVFREHWLCSLEKKYVTFGIHCDPGGFSHGHAFGKLKKIANDFVRKLRNRLKWGAPPRTLLRAEGE